MREMEQRIETIERACMAILQRLALPIPDEIAETQREPMRLHIPDEILARFDTEDDQ